MTILEKKITNEVTEIKEIIKTLPKNTAYILKTSNGKIIKLDTSNTKLLKFAKDKGLT